MHDVQFGVKQFCEFARVFQRVLTMFAEVCRQQYFLQVDHPDSHALGMTASR